VTFSVYGRWDHGSTITAETAERINAVFRPDDGSVCAWVDEKDANVLLVCVDVEAADLEAAVTAGRSALSEAAQLGPLDGRAVQVVAMTEEAQMTWSA
jgi:cytidine deaminase